MTTEEQGLPVLVVDDNPADQNLTAIHLRAAWPFDRTLQLEFAVDGVEALAKLRTKYFTFVVLDWSLPVLGQGEVLRQLRENKIRIPVVVISGVGREEIHADLAALQAAFLSKDEMNPETFWAAISESLKLLDFKTTRFSEAPPDPRDQPK